MTHQLTVRYDDEIEEAIVREARAQGVSKNRAALRLIRRGANLEPTLGRSGKIGNSLDWFIGSASEEETRELKESLKMFDVIDQELWK